jgi:hypothetical protein
MAGYAARNGARVGPLGLGDGDLSIDDWMAGRNAQVALQKRADLAGRQAWADSIYTGKSVNASQSSDIRAVGMRSLAGQPTPANLAHGYNPNEPRDEHGRWTTGVGLTAQPQAQNRRTISYGLLTAPTPSAQELAELRRKQTALANVSGKLDAQYGWLAIPAIAAPVALGGMEAAALLEARAALAEIEQAPLNFVERDPHLRVGDNWATRAGRRAHAALETRLDGKDGWDYEPKVNRPGKRPLRPDGGTPPRNPVDPDERNYVELKPNTKSGRAAAARSVKRYQKETGRKVRAIFYDPKDYM